MSKFEDFFYTLQNHVHSRLGFFNFTGKLQGKTIYSEYITEG